MTHKNSIKVSVLCLTYNHEIFIKDALEGILNQQTNFYFELLIRDDCSTDRTANIIKEYELKYPNIIKPIYLKENEYSKGLAPLHQILKETLLGEYIAICEGDDYWCDPLKLQKQVDFLEVNPEFIGCSHNTKVLRENSKNNQEEFIVNNPQKDIFTIDDFTKGEAYFHTTSYLYRYKENRDAICRIFYRFRGDWFLSMVFASFGPIKYIDEVMSVYRIHDKGVWSELSAQEQVMKNLEGGLHINKAFDYAYEENLMQLFARVFITNDFDKSIANLMKLFETQDKNDLIKIISYIEKYISKERKSIEEERKSIEEERKSIEEERKSIEEYKQNIKNIQSTKLYKIYNKLRWKK
jgi:glycosyltransferase involved in cell wall biosynthesis